MGKLVLLHGSDHKIEKPEYSLGKSTNDYGKGFYCTEDLEMAKEWACKGNKNGFVNKYELDISELKVLNLFDKKYTILNWMALLLKNRVFSNSDEISLVAKEYILNNFLIDVSQYDIVIGYRADDSYFSYAQSFINNTLPLGSLSKAFKLGDLGVQTVLVSKKSFDRLKFIGSEPVLKEEYYPKFFNRDTTARSIYRNEIRKATGYKNDIFVMDILREEMKNDDIRIQQIIFK